MILVVQRHRAGIQLGHSLQRRRVVVKQHAGQLAEFIHIVQHSCRGSIAGRGIIGHGLHDDLLQTARNIGIEGRRHLGAAVDVLDRHRDRGLAVIRRSAGDHFIHHDTQRIQVAAVIHPAALGLLGRNVMHRTQSLSGQCVAFGHHPGDAEVSHLHAAVFQHHDIVRLDIPVDDPPAVGMLQGLADLNGKMQGLLPVQNALLFHVLLQADTVDQLHDDIVRLLGGRNIVHRHNIGMADHRDSLALRMEAAAELFVLAIIILQNFNSNQPI